MKKVFYIFITLIITLYHLNSNDWRQVNSLGGHKVYSINCPDSNNCFALVQYLGYPALYKSTDQGRTWDSIYQWIPFSEEPWGGNIIKGVSPNPNYYYFTWYDNPLISKSTDGGHTFKRILFDTIDVGNRMTSFTMYDSLKGIAFSGPYYHITTDGWETYKSTRINIPYFYKFSPTFIDSNTIYFIHYGKIIDSLIMLARYRIQEDVFDTISYFRREKDTIHVPVIYHFSFINDSLGFACGDQYSGFGNNYYDLIYRTKDGGFNWELVMKRWKEPYPYGLSEIKFHDEKNGMAVGYKKVYLTKDGGDTWEFSNLLPEMPDCNTISLDWAGVHPIIGTYNSGIGRYEGDFFKFPKDTNTPTIQAENQNFKTKEIHDTTTTIKKIKIHNLSDYTDLNISGFSEPTESAFTNQFVWLDTMTYITVKPNEYFELPVSFKPTEMRKYKDSIIVFSNASILDSVIALEGEGIDSTIGVVDYGKGIIKFKVTFSNDILRVLVDKTNFSNILINVYDINGNLISNKSSDLKLGLNDFDIDLSKLISSTYIYNVSMDGITINTGKMSIVR